MRGYFAVPKTRVLRGALAVLLAPAVLALPVPAASADPLPTDYTGATHGDVLDVNLQAFAAGAVDAVIAESTTNVASTASPSATASSANLEAGAVGVGVGVSTAQATAGDTTPSDSYSSTELGQVDAAPLLDTGLITGTGSATWAGDTACVPDGRPIATSTTALAGATLTLPIGLEILDLGASQTTGSTTLDAGDVVATSSGNLSSLTLVNDLVTVSVNSQPVLTARSDGTTGTVSVNNYTVTVTGPGISATVGAGGSVPIKLSVAGVADVDLVLRVGTLADTSAGATGAGSMTFLTVEGTITEPVLLGGDILARVNVGILPLSATATAPGGGVECTALDPPVITSPAGGATTSETPTISGTGVPGATVTVTEDGVRLGTAVVAGDGTWPLTPTTPLAPGAHTITATQSTDGLTSGISNAVSFTVVDTTAPAAPQITAPADGATVGTATPTVTGTGEPGATVTIRIDDTVVGTTTVASNGTWSLSLSASLADGTHVVEARQTDAAGNTSPADSHTFTVDTAAPGAPQITAPAEGTVTGDDTPTIRGTAEPRATVTIRIDGTAVGTTTADGSGAWAFTPTALADGSHTVTATATDEAGNVSPTSTTVGFVVDTTAPAAPQITAPADGATVGTATPTVTGTGEPDATVTIRIDGTVVGTTTVATDGTWALTSPALADGTHVVTARQTDPAGNTSAQSAAIALTIDTTVPAPVILTPTDAEITSDATPRLSGTGEVGATIVVSVDGTVLGRVVVGPDGSWSLTPSAALAEGRHTVEAVATDLAGNVSTATTHRFVVDLTAPAAPVITAPADGTVFADHTPTIAGTGEAGATVVVSIAGRVVGTTTVGRDGRWSLTLTTSLRDGDHLLEARQADKAGNISGAASVAFTVATVSDPEVASPEPGSATGDRTPTFRGIGEPGATVRVLVDGELLGTTEVGADGRWDLVPETPLACGRHTLRIVQQVDGPDGRALITSPITRLTVACTAHVGGPPGGDTGGDTGWGPALPDTGLPEAAAPLGAAGALLALAGTVLLRRARRRPVRTASPRAAPSQVEPVATTDTRERRLEPEREAAALDGLRTEATARGSPHSDKSRHWPGPMPWQPVVGLSRYRRTTSCSCGVGRSVVFGRPTDTTPIRPEICYG